MFWNKKKRGKGLPDLPSEPRAAPSMRDYRPSMASKIREINGTPSSFPISEIEKIHNLPSFPDSPMKQGFSQSAIKEAVETGEVKEESPIPRFPDDKIIKGNSVKVPNLIEMEEWKPTGIPNLPEKTDIPNHPSHKQVFVKLEKFQSARKSIETVGIKLQEIDELLQTIREVKQKEDQEISAWEKEIENIKSRIHNVSSEIFDNPQ